MKEKTISITTKDEKDKKKTVKVGIAYCFATEIAYNDLIGGGTLPDFIQEAAVAFDSKPPRMPDIKKTIYAILAAIIAYSEAKGIEPTVKGEDLMQTATPDEVAAAIGTLIGLFVDFYHIPVGEPADKPEETKGKKQKNA